MYYSTTAVSYYSITTAPAGGLRDAANLRTESLGYILYYMVLYYNMLYHTII